MSNLSATSNGSAISRRDAPMDATVTSIREFLAFKLGAEEYGMDLLCVQETRSYEQPTCMANAPAFIKGVINLRGVIVPIIDMRIKFYLERVNYDTFSVLIVLNIGRQMVGMVVDGVSDVISLTPEQLRPVSEFSSIIGSDHLLAIGSVQDRMLMLLDIEKLLTSAEMRLLAAISAISPSGINKANDAKENAGQLFQGVL